MGVCVSEFASAGRLRPETKCDDEDMSQTLLAFVSSPFTLPPVMLSTRRLLLALVFIASTSIAADEEGFVSVFNGKDFTGWKGPVENYEVKDGAIICKKGKGGTIYTAEEYSDFVVRLEIKIPAGCNNGLAIRYPGTGDTAYVGMCELQVLDDDAPKYAKLDPRQYHGSAYGMVAAKRGHLNPAGEWNVQEVIVKGSNIAVILNGVTILDADLSKVNLQEVAGKKPHPGINRTSGFFGLAGHSDPVEFRNIRIKRL